MKTNLLSLIAFLALGTTSLLGQEYLEMIDKGTYSVHEIIESANNYFEEVGTEKGTGYVQFKRWEYGALRMQDDEGNLKSQDFYNTELARFESYLNESTEARSGGSTGNWEEMGPTDWEATSGWNPGVGRITSFVVDPANDNHIIVGAPNGGVWNTYDGGTTWNPLMDYFSNMDVYALAMDPADSDTYFAGSVNGRIYKSTDAGATWNLLGIAGGGSFVNKILLHPTDSNIIFASNQSQGLYRSTDGGTTWTNVNPSSTRSYDIEFKPGDPSVVYSSGDFVYKSTNGGASFSALSGFAGALPKMMGVSADDPERLYVIEVKISAETGGYVFGKFYRSYNAGASFTAVDHGSDNYFGYSTTGDDQSSQAPSDMDIAVNPANADEVYIAGILVWRSTNAGTSFQCTATWFIGGGLAYHHADVDILDYVNGELYVGSDGGLFTAENPLGTFNSSYYTDLTQGLGIRQFYRIGISQSDPVLVSGGSQDNGTSILGADGVWRDWLGADGMETYVDKDNNDLILGAIYFARMYRSFNGGTTIQNLGPPNGDQGAWVAPVEQDMTEPNTLYVGASRLYKSSNSGSSYTAVSQAFPRDLEHAKIAESNNQIMYGSYTFSGASTSVMYKTTDGGATNWTNVTGFTGRINSIAINPNDPNKVAIATTNESSRVWVTEDGGDTWINYKKNLPEFSALALVWDNTSVNGLYLGMNYGLFYIDDTFSDWQIYNANLPNVRVRELEINHVNDRIYAATYGRGLWSSPVYENVLSVDDNQFESIVKLYPNPAASSVSFNWPTSSEVDIQVFDINGRLLINQKNVFVQNSYELNIENLSTGIHFVRLTSEGATLVRKLVID